MANFALVNQAVKQKFPELDIEVVRGVGYVYFGGDDGFGIVESVYSHPVSTTTETMIKFCIRNIEDSLVDKE